MQRLLHANSVLGMAHLKDLKTNEQDFWKGRESPLTSRKAGLDAGACLGCLAP